MIIASLLDLGVPKETFLEELKKVNLEDKFEIKIESKNESGILGTKVKIISKENNVHRHLIDIFNIINNSSLNQSIKNRAKEIFITIGEAEAKVHGTTIDKIQFYEVGAIDSIVDIIGVSILIDLLCVDKIYSNSIPLGSGFVKCNNEILLVPAPVTIEILKNTPVKLNTVRGECTTPTGAAIIKTICDEFIDIMEFEINQVGYGMGHKKFEVPNILRTILGKKKEDLVYEIILNIDDMSLEVYSYIFDRILNEVIYILQIYIICNNMKIFL